MSIQNIHMTDALDVYVRKISLHESAVLADLRRATAKLPGAVMQILPEQGQFMAFLARLIQARKTLDIGTFTGYSALAIAEALPKHGRVITCDINKDTTKIAKHFWQQAGLAHKIESRLAPASDTLNELITSGEANTFDFIFIDADKRQYQEYYERSLTLLRPGGIIAIDNVLRGGDVINPKVESKATKAIKTFNQALHQDKRVYITLIPLADGLSLAQKR